MLRFSVCRPAIGLGKLFGNSRGMATAHKVQIGDRKWLASTRGQNAPLFSPASDRNKDPILEVLRQNLDFAKFNGTNATPLTPLFFLELSGGSGQHIAHFSHALRSHCPIVWQPSDAHTDGFFSVQHYVKKHQASFLESQPQAGDGFDSFVLEPVVIDVMDQHWVVEAIDGDSSSYWGQNPPKCISHAENLVEGLEARAKLAFDGNKEKLFDVVFSSNMAHITPFDCTKGMFAGVGKVLRKGGQFFIYGPFNVDGKFTSQGNANFDVQLKGTNSDWGIRDVETMEELGRKNGLDFVKKVQMPANNLMLIFVKNS